MQRRVFDQPGGEHLRTWIDACPNSLYAALTFQGGAAWRRRLADDIGHHPEVAALLEGLSDGELAEVCRTAVMGRSGPDALASMAGAYRRFALDHPGVYPLTQVARPGDEVYEAAAGRVLEPVMATLAGLGIPPGQQVDAARSVRSALHGFALLETGRGFGLADDVESSFGWLVAMLGRGLTPE